MVEHQIRRRSIRTRRVLDAFLAVPRHRFLPFRHTDQAYEDHPVEIGSGQTISQPYIVALMTDALGLRGAERVLEIGTGSGYQTAILAELCAQVYTIERIPDLGRTARKLLEALGYAHIHYRVGDGTLGWPEAGAFDGIIVTAGAPNIPESLQGQLAEGGRLVMPVGGRGGQDLVAITRRGKEFKRERLCGCVFVRLIGQEGWPER